MKTLITALAAGTLMLSGCSTMRSEPEDLDIQSSKDVILTDVHIDRNGREVVVHGSLRPKNTAVTRVGHVDVEFISKGEGVLQTVKAKTNTNQFSRKSSRRPTFSATVEIEAFDTVRLIHHPDSLQQCEL